MVLSSYTLETKYAKKRIKDMIIEREVMLNSNSMVSRFHNHVTEKAKELDDNISDKEILNLFNEANEVYHVYSVKALNRGNFSLLARYRSSQLNRVDHNNILRNTFAICNLYGDLSKKPKYICIYCRFGKIHIVDRSR